MFKISECPEYIPCRICRYKANKIISLPQSVRPDWDPYYDEVLDVMIEGRGHRRELMKQQGLEDKSMNPSIFKERKQEREHKKRERGIENGRKE